MTVTQAIEVGLGYALTMETKTASAGEILNQALTLDEKDRASVAGALIESLHTELDSDAEQAWDAEIRRRVAELDSGAVQTIPWSEVRKRLFRGFG
jgi:putative addiction module component (TIGR02574 family)